MEHEIIFEDDENEFTFDFSEDGEGAGEGDGDGEGAGGRVLKVRLDKWLWAARFFKTRALARAAVEAGKVFYNGERSKPSREIELEALLQIRQGRFEKTVIVKGLSTRRRSTDEALQLFEETEDSIQMREQFANDWPQQQPNHHFQNHYPNQYGNQYGHHSGNQYGHQSGGNQYGHQSGNQYGSPYSPYPEQRERRVVRFLRRSFNRNNEQQQPERRQPRNLPQEFEPEIENFD